MLDQKLALYKEMSNKCQRSVLNYLAEQGPNSVYGLARDLGYLYPSMHHETKKLQERWDLVIFRRESVGYRMKKIVDINFKGMMVFLSTLEKDEKGVRKRIENAVKKHPDLIPFSKQWYKIEDIIGNELTYKEVINASVVTVGGNYVEARVDKLNLKFRVFIPGYFSSYIWFRTSLEGKGRNLKFATFLGSQQELKNAYISFLAIQDILDLANNNLETHELEKLRSERELAFFENRNPEKNRLFPNRLREFLPKYAPLKYMFTGLFLTRLLWKPIKKKPTGFHVSLLK